MSWSVSGIGKPVALAAKLVGDFTRISPMKEPEETGKNAAAMAIAAIVPAFPPNTLVKVEANGSQYTPDSAKSPNIHINSLTISIQSMGAIVE
jgi:hypothetical protein